MATKDGSPPTDRFPLFLSEQAEESGLPAIGPAPNRAVISSRILKTSILVVAPLVTATAIGLATLSAGDPVALLADVTVALVDKSALQPGTDQPTRAIQSTEDTQDLPPAAKDAPTREEVSAALEPSDQGQTEISQPPAEALLKQFQAWAAEDDTQGQVAPAQPAVQPVQEAPTQVVQDAAAQIQPVKKHRQVRSVHDARAEMRADRNPRAKVRRKHHARAKVRGEEKNTRAQVPSAPDARTQDQPVSNAQAPWFLQSFGWRN